MIKILIVTILFVGSIAIGILTTQYGSGSSVSQNEHPNSNLSKEATLDSTLETEQLRSQLAKAKTRIRHLEQELAESVKASTQKQNVAINQDGLLRPGYNATSVEFEKTDIKSVNQAQTNKPIDALQAEETLIDFENDYWQEPLDYQWTETIQTEIEASLAEQSIPDASLDRVECHSTLCLVEFVHSKPSGHDTLLQRLPTMAAFSKEFLVKTDESSGDFRTLVFVPEKGNTFPLAIQTLMKGELQ